MDCKSIEGKLIEAGEKLSSPPSSTIDLLSLLDETEKLLASIDLFPSSEVISALQPIKAALAAKRMLSHPNNDVRVSVTLCICEISRIIAPEDPCDDDRMKEFFMRIVESFAKLDDFNSRSFYKRVSILETVAKIKSCILMIDLDYDDLILDLFNQFLNRISLKHEANISFYMETIMSLVLKESDEISKDLVSCLLRSVKKRRMVNMLVSFRLGENVIRNCADKLKPMLKELVGNKAKEYSEIVAYICQDASGIMEQKKSTKEVEQEPEEAKCPQKEGTESNSMDINLDILRKDVISAKKNANKFGRRKANVDGSRRLKRKQGPESEMDKDKGDKINDKASRRKRQVKHGENIVGKRIQVWWPLDKAFYNGAVVEYNHSDKKHTVIYDDGDSEVLILKDEVWNYLEEAIEHTVLSELGRGMKKTRTSSRKEKKATPRRSKTVANSKAKKLAETPRTGTVSKKDSKSKECGSKITLKLKLNEPTEKASGAVGANSSSKRRSKRE